MFVASVASGVPCMPQRSSSSRLSVQVLSVVLRDSVGRFDVDNVLGVVGEGEGAE